jgi:hypothetical protein
MKTYTEEQVRKIVRDHAEFSDVDQTDYAGQVIIYTGVFLWSDGSFRDEEEPKMCYTCEEDKDCEEHGPSQVGCKCHEDTTECPIHAHSN